MNYKRKHTEQLKDERWKYKSFEIKERDLCCQKCGTFENLNVHHKLYIKDRDLWDYPDEYLITLCQRCHKEEHLYLTKINDIIDNCKLILLNSELYKTVKNLDINDYTCKYCGEEMSREHVEIYGNKCLNC